MPSPEALRAADPATPADELRRLASRGDCEAAVASNPNAPLDALRDLCAAHADRVLDNPAFELALLAHPALLDGFEPAALGALARSPRCSLSVVEALVPQALPPDDGGPRRVRMDLLLTLLERPDLTPAMLEQIYALACELREQGVDFFVAERLLDDPRATPALLGQFARVGSPSAEFVERLLANPRFPKSELHVLLEVFPERVGLLLAGDPATPPALLMRLIGSTSPQIRRMARANPALPPAFAALLDRLGFAPSMETAQAPPPDRAMSDEDMESLHDGGAWFQLYLARRPDLAPPLRERLQKTSNPMVRQLMKKHAARKEGP